MIVLVLTACPEGLRGYLTRWLMEVSAGVFVGSTSKRVREELWSRSAELVGSGRAIMIHTARTEQGFAVRSHGHHWTPEDFDGITLLRRPPADEVAERQLSGWSSVSRRRRRR